MINYDDRRLTSVDVWNVQVHRMGNGDTNVSGQLMIRMSSADGDDNGPQVQIGLATTSVTEDPTIRGAEYALLEAASAFLKRVAAEDPANLQAFLSKERDQPQENAPLLTNGV